MERSFEDLETAKAYQRYRFSYEGLGMAEQMVSYLYAKLEKDPDTLAVDVGCGTGFMTRILAPHFTRIIGLDCSAAQIKVAEENTTTDNITYKEGFAENLDFLSPGSVDLVTVAIAVHWLGTDRFFAEVERVLKPGGCVALMMYDQQNGKVQICELSTKAGNKEVDTKCQRLLNSIFTDDIFFTVGEVVKKLITTNVFPSPSYKESYCFRVVSEKNGDIELWVGFLKTLGKLLSGEMAGRSESKIEFYKQRLLDILREISPSPDTVALNMKAGILCTLYRKPINKSNEYLQK